MSTTQQVANCFVTEFFECLAKNPVNLGEFYGHRSSLTINDFEMGTTEAHDADVPAAIQQWATIVTDSQLQVESVHSAQLYGGLNVFVTLTATGAQQQYFQVSTTLEGYTSSYGMEGYYVRHQIVSRIGALPTPQPEAAPEVAPEPEKPVEKMPDPEREMPKSKARKTESEEPAKAAPVPAETEAPVEEGAPAAAPAPAPAAPAARPGPKSWASLVSAKGGISSNAPVRVVGTHEAKKEEEATPAAARAHPQAGAASAAAAGAPKEPRREKRVAERVGDRLMFNVDFVVTEDDIRAALGEVAASLVSLRNHSDRGHVFMDFAFGANVFEEIRKINPVIGESKTKISIYRQRDREQRPRE